MKYSNKKSNTLEFIKRSNNVHNDKYDYSIVDYKNNSTKVKIICKQHGVFEQLPVAHINFKQGCPKCKGGVSITKEDFIKNSTKIHYDNYDYTLVEYKNMKTKVKIICKKHGVFEQIPDNHIRKKYGCPKCKKSKNEILIEKIFIDNNIKFETQKTFDGCKYKQKLKFDFYLTDFNTCIEYDGEQHFKKYRFEKDDSNLNIRKLRDQIKTDYCKNNNIQLIRIKYNENIEKKLNFLINI
ncbi:DUF723 domain-containing protein [Trichloromonas sp.]|jgi:very-short-patch-repair endonuclease|uniref:DUF723 domain-containing protein n=1 Tax=Trichloromonas sp. TaxID=3069249 RepID=UPI002A47699B|nr:DUF723 domain-containing protein [Trichloromonas sp.]